MKIIVKTQEEKNELIRQSQYIHDYIFEYTDLFGKELIASLDSDQCGIFKQIHNNPDMIEVEINPTIAVTEVSPEINKGVTLNIVETTTKPEAVKEIFESVSLKTVVEETPKTKSPKIEELKEKATKAKSSKTPKK